MLKTNTNSSNESDFEKALKSLFEVDWSKSLLMNFCHSILLKPSKLVKSDL